MGHEDKDERERAIRDRIVSLIQANEQASHPQINSEELQKLKTAASRLDQMLSAAEDADREALRNAAARLDQMLADIDAGKDVAAGLKRRGE